MIRKQSILLVCAVLLLTAGCAEENDMNRQKKQEADNTPSVTQSVTKQPEGEVTKEPVKEVKEEFPEGASVFTIDTNKTYQTIESFGASGAWWAQYVGGWDKPYKGKELATREEIARLLFSVEEGIGLTSYRYNIGAGSMDSGNGTYSDMYRRAQSFETEAGVYDFSKDANAMWMLNRAVELGVEEVILFCNSAPERLTLSGKAYGVKGYLSNLPAANYKAFATYVFDVTEHMLSLGYPVKFVSPINEPQWDWTGGQEGCHFEPAESAALYITFLEELKQRDALRDTIELSGPESGEWGGNTTSYVKALLNNKALKEHFETIDCHSYWTNAATKVTFAAWMEKNYPEVKLRTSEWCEMVNGSDYTMDSAFNMFDVIYEDLTILDVVSWQCWVAVAPGNYRDGLIYVNQSKQACRAAKRLWGYGNYTRFVRPGYTRVALTADRELKELNATAYTGTNAEGGEELVLVLSNRGDEKEIYLSGILGNGYRTAAVHVTNEEKDLIMTEEKSYDVNEPIVIEEASIVTVILSK